MKKQETPACVLKEANRAWQQRVLMLKAGQVLYDNDPRYRGRKVEFVRVDGPYAVCMCGPRQVKIRLDYIFSDGMPRRSGYSVAAKDDSLIAST
jgi:hypothetical protein